MKESFFDHFQFCLSLGDIRYLLFIQNISPILIG